jgi:hypothetical protein
MSLPATGYCTDEDLAIRAGSDYGELVPQDQALAAGNDGAFGGADRWTLTATSIPSFAAQGVTPGSVAIVNVPRQGMALEPQHLIVATVTGPGLTLRRKGLAIGQGQPPAPPGGIGNLQFSVATLGAEIIRASYEINHRLGLDPTIPGRSPADLADPIQLTEACVLAVLWKRYFALAQRGNPEATNPPDERAARAASYWAKQRILKGELDQVLARLVIKFSGSSLNGPRDQPTTGKFHTRMER